MNNKYIKKTLTLSFLLLLGAITGCVNTTTYTSSMYGNNPNTITVKKGKKEVTEASYGAPLANLD